MEEQIAVKGNNKSKKSSKKNKNNKNNLEIEKNRKYWIYRGLGIGGGVLALITLFLINLERASPVRLKDGPEDLWMKSIVPFVTGTD